MVNVAILGFGTVGSGVAEVLTQNAASIARRAGQEIRLKYILDTREFPDSPFAEKLTHHFEDILNDPDVEVVVECIGGASVAFDFVRRCLLAGKHVATSNKEMVATRGYELLQIAKEKNVNFLFEASVGGGIPLLTPLTFSLAANEITDIYGILNGTTNYILTRMIREGVDFDTVLRDAQKNGYAERNPADDVEGHDACRKICILAALAYGRHIYPKQVPTAGITYLEMADIRMAMSGGYRVKLLGRASKLENGQVLVYVSPHLIPEENQLSHVDDVFNGIMIHGNAVDDVMFYGRGAGKMPTASAVVADVIDAVMNKTARKPVDWDEGGDNVVADLDAQPMRWFVRTGADAAAVEAALGPVTALPHTENGEQGFITGRMPRSAVQAAGGAKILSLVPVLE